MLDLPLQNAFNAERFIYLAMALVGLWVLFFLFRNYCRNHKKFLAWRDRALLVASLLYFLSWGNRSLAFFLVTVSLVWAYQFVPRGSRWRCGAVLSGILLILFLAARLPAFWGGKPVAVIGSRYYILSALSFLWTKAKQSQPLGWKRVALCLGYFPVNFIGPISGVRKMDSLLDASGPVDARSFLKGLLIGASGFFRIFVVANNLNWLFILGQRDATLSLLDAYPLAIIDAFFVFATLSGCAEICRAVSCTLGIDVEKTFDSPYLAHSAVSYWARWNKSVQDWIRDNVFFFLLATTRNTWIAIILAYQVTAFWHGIGWGFFAWGIMWALIALLWRPAVGRRSRLRAWATSAVFFHLVVIPFFFVGRQGNGDLFRAWFDHPFSPSVLSWQIYAFAFFCIALLIAEESIARKLERRSSVFDANFGLLWVAHLSVVAFFMATMGRFLDPLFFYLT